jgi:aminoglycoside 2'-N-acetyltransferase I
MHIESFSEADVPAVLRRQVRELQQEVWPSPPGEAASLEGPVHDPALHPLSMLLVDNNGIVVAALDVLSKSFEHAGARYTAAGLTTVVTRPDSRGRGHGGQLVAAARESMADQGFDLGIFTCDRELRSFYVGAGWHVLPGTVLIGGTPADPFPSDQPGFDKLTLGAFFTRAAQQAESTFYNARIPLHPGTIDKLW